jgi:hypothetical protein
MTLEPTGDQTAKSHALVGISSTIRGLLSSATRDDVLTRHRAGTALCVVVQAPNTYGTRAIEVIAMDVGVSETKLRQHVAVARCWTAGEMERLVEETTAHGHPLSWSHLVVLTRVRGRKRRAALTEAAIASGWTVRELVHQVESGGDGSVGARVEEPREMQATLRDGIELGRGAVAEVRSFAEAFTRRLADATLVDDGLLDDAERTYRELRASVDAAIDRLAAAKRSRATAPVTTDGTADETVDEEEADEDEHASPRRREYRP